MSIVIISNSLLTTIQDLGRKGFQRFGVNNNGAMDKTAVRLINILLGNDENEAVLEIHFPAPKILFEKSAVIALGGADFGAKVDVGEIDNWRPIVIEKGKLLQFEQKKYGNRVYLSVKGGFKVEEWLGSASTNLKARIGGFAGRSLQKNDRLFFKQKINGNKENEKKVNYKISRNLIPRYSPFPTVRITAGAEFDKLTKKSCEDFLAQKFAIRSQCDRMGFYLEGLKLTLSESFELLSSAVNFGTIQLLPDGQMIILMADHQTTGGYPRLAHVVQNDLPVLAQLGANDTVNFRLISLAEAEDLILTAEKDLNLLRVGCNFKKIRNS